MNGICLWKIVFMSKIMFLYGISVDEYSLLPSKILREFPGYNIAFHYDSNSKDELSLFFLQDLLPTTIYLFNYDYQLHQFRRPIGYKYLHVVLLKNPFMFEIFTVVQFNLEYNDAVIFVQERLDLHEHTDDIFPENRFWQQDGLDRCGSIFLFDSVKEDFYYVHYYVGNTSGLLRSLEVPYDGEVPRLLNHMNEFKDFKGHVFEVAYFPYRPFIWCSKKSLIVKMGNVATTLLLVPSEISYVNSGRHASLTILSLLLLLSFPSSNSLVHISTLALVLTALVTAFFSLPKHADLLNVDTGKYECGAEGIDGNILLLLSRYLNFKFVMRKAELKSGGVWKGMIEDVHLNRRDWAVGGISTSLERLQYCDFTTMLHMESYTAFYTSPVLVIDDWDVVLRPFQVLPWTLLMVFLLLVSLVLGLAEKASLVEKSKQRQALDFIGILFHTVVDQSIPRLHVRAVTVRLMLVVWCLASIILTTAYKSKLAASMITPARREPNTVLDLYELGYSFQVNIEDWTVLQQSLMNSIDQRYQKLLDRCYDDLSFCEAIRKTIYKKVAVLDEETAMPYIIFNSCQHVYTPYQLSRFRLVRQVMFPSVHAWPLQLGSPFRRKFSRLFQQLVSAGIIEHWYESLIGRSITTSNSYTVDSSTTNALTTDTFIGLAFILVLGELLAGLVFICEIIHKKYTS